jgi:hypothetical protein
MPSIKHVPADNMRQYVKLVAVCLLDATSRELLRLFENTLALPRNQRAMIQCGLR